MTFFECTRLSAKISKVSCKGNKFRGVFACEGCKGLGAETTIEREEPTMATKHKPCLMVGEGCKAHAWKQGFCWKHHPSHAKNKVDACADKQAIRDIHKAAITGPALNEWEVGVIDHQVSDHEIHIVNLVDVFKQKQAAELDLFICELSKLAEPYDKLMFAYKAVNV